MMTALIVLALLAQPQTVTFTHACGQSSVVLAALGEELGLTLKPSGSVSKDYFLVRFKDVPVQEAFDKIAETLNATWTRKGGVTYLGRSRAQDRQDASTGQSYVGQSLRKWIEQRRPNQEYTLDYAEQLFDRALPLVNDPEGASWQKLQGISAQAPISRFLTRIVEEIGSDSLSKMVMGDIVQYSTSPNASQRPMPQGEALRLLAEENATHVAALNKTGALSMLSRTTMRSSLFSPYNLGLFEIGRVKVTFVRDYTEMEVRVSAGWGTADERIPIERPEGEGVPQELTGSTDKIDWQPVVLQIVEILQPLMTGQGDDAVVPEDLKDLFSDPVKNEFLETIGSRWILDAVERRGLNVVAVLSDDAGFLGMLSAAQQFNEGRLWSMLPSLESSYDFALEGGWLTFAPSRPAEVRAFRIDREMLRDAIGLHKRAGGATIDSIAKFVSASDHELHSMFATLIGALGTGDPDLILASQSMNVNVLRLYNQLTPRDKAQAHRGGAVLPLPQRGAAFTKYMNKVLFGDKAQLRPEPRAKSWPDLPSYGLLGPEGDPFDKLGDGYPRGSTVKFMVIERQLVYPQPKRATRPQGHTPEALGQAMAWSEKLPVNNASDYQRFVVEPAQRLVVEFQFPGIGFVYAETQIDRLPAKLEYLPLESLPQRLQEEVAVALNKYREQYKDMKAGGRAVPPPRS